jgi:hypothetical protein
MRADHRHIDKQRQEAVEERKMVLDLLKTQEVNE